MLTIALPKGRVADSAILIFQKVLNKEFAFENRKLILDVDEFRFLLVRNQDVPTYVAHQAADLGIVGLDVLEEKEMDLIKLLNLGIGKCRVIVGIKEDEALDYSKPEIKIATKMVNIAKNYFAKKAMAVDIIKLYGSIELAPLVGLADAIVDIEETGATLRQNNLKVAEVIMESTAHLVANPNSFYSKKDDILNLSKKIKEFI